MLYRSFGVIIVVIIIQKKYQALYECNTLFLIVFFPSV